MTLYRRKLPWLILVALFVAIALALAAGAQPAQAAVDCTVAHSLRVEIVNTDAADANTRIDHAGAQVKISPDPLDGIGTRTIADNGAYDDSPLLGRIQVAEACSSASGLARDDYTITLSFDAGVFDCDIAEANQSANLAEGNDDVTFNVDDCAAAATPTPTATATPTATNTPTASPTPQPTSTPTPAATAVPATPVTVFVPVPIVTTIEVPVAASTSSGIRPPNTGDGGIR